MTLDHSKVPFPYFGGKRYAAQCVWSALGDVDHYVEPFAGSLAVLLCRPHRSNRTYYSETVNDADGLLVNAWRGIQLHPDETAEAASWPVSEADLHARHSALVRWRAEHELEHLMGDPAWCDPVMAGWWVWGCSCWIGGGWCSGQGPWVVSADGRLTKRDGSEPGVRRQRPHLSNNGQGANHPSTREPGVWRQLPHLSNNGQGANHPRTREPGVSRKLPHLSCNGRGANHPSTREPGVARDEPHVWQPADFHPMTMPELRTWFRFLAARLRHVRILNGDWRRAVTGGATKTLAVRKGGHAAIFLDPPYAGAVRDNDIYAVDSGTVAADVRAWCVEHGDDPQLRVVLAGFAGEGHEALEEHGWTAAEWFKAGHLRGGMAQQSEAGTQQARERLWLSPQCLSARKQGEMW